MSPQFSWRCFWLSSEHIQVTAWTHTSGAVSHCSGETGAWWDQTRAWAHCRWQPEMLRRAATNWSGCWAASWQGSEQSGPVAVSPAPYCQRTACQSTFFQQAKNSSRASRSLNCEWRGHSLPWIWLPAGPRPDYLPGSHPWSNWYYQCYAFEL